MDRSSECDPYDKFDVKAYTVDLYADLTAWNAHSLKILHDFYCSMNTTGLKILEIGSGPVPIHQCSAVPYASEIVFSDYARPNLIALQKWINKDPTAIDFTPFFEYVVQELEGKQPAEAAKRQDELRQLVKGNVIHCDVRLDPLLPKGYEGPYDIIFSSLAIQCACSSIEDYKRVIQRLTNCLKVGGKLILNITEKVPCEIVHEFNISNETYCEIGMNTELHNIILSEAGYKDIMITSPMQALDHDPPRSFFTFFSIATRA